MGLIKAALGAMGGTMADQWKEFFYCEALPEDVLVTKGQKKTTGRSSNYKGDDNIITSGSVIAVADGQCMLIVEQGRVVEVAAEPGEFIFDSSTEPTVFSGSLGDSIVQVFQNVGKRFTFGGEAPKDQRVYYFNTKEIMGNKYGTPTAMPFRVVDERAGIDMDISIRCFGEYSYRIANPLLFYTAVCGNVSEDYTRDRMDSQMKSELLDAMKPSFARISEKGIRYSALIGHTKEIRDCLREELAEIWTRQRGIEIVNFGISSVNADEKQEAELREMQREAIYFNDPGKMAARLGNAQAEAMKAAASNTATGPAMAFMGMGMANQAGGMNAQNLYQQSMQQQQMQQQMAQQQAAPAAPAGWTCACGQTGNQGKFCAGCGQPKPVPAEAWTCSCGQTGNTGKFCASCGQPKPAPDADGSWKCSCGAVNTGKFCMECGSPKPAAAPEGWTCSCGAVNKGKFCMECGKPKPAGVPQYKCDKCGWEPADPTHPPKFCPQCGDPFDDGDIK